MLPICELRTPILSVVLKVPRLNNLGTRPQEQSSLETVSLTDRAQCMRMSSIDVGLHYDSMVMLTCKLHVLLAAASAIVLICPGSHKLCPPPVQTPGTMCNTCSIKHFTRFVMVLIWRQTDKIQLKSSETADSRMIGRGEWLPTSRRCTHIVPCVWRLNPSGVLRD